MKFLASTVSFLVALGSVDAFPHLALDELQRRTTIGARSGGSASGVPFPPDPAQVSGYFDASLQYVSNKGAHAFVAPGTSPKSDSGF